MICKKKKKNENLKMIFVKRNVKMCDNKGANKKNK